MNRPVTGLLILALGGCGQDPPGNVGEHNNEDIKTQTSTVEADAAPSGRILRAGIFSKVSGGNVIDSADTSTGKALSQLVMTFIREAERIPIKKGTILGYQYRLSNLPDMRSVQLRRVLRHPPFTLPDGTVSTGSEFTINKRVERNEVFAYDVYALNETYEMVEGEWIFQIYYRDRLLIDRKFTTYYVNDEAGKLF
ncbi:MAG: DUF3859 domain-containing protein [Thiogranum sp.]|nr:DUF3859 domain-containing protein [Thiogranum sp.]